MTRKRPASPRRDTVLALAEPNVKQAGTAARSHVGTGKDQVAEAAVGMGATGPDA